MSGIRGLLVDLDGTLVDTAEANYRAYAEALAEVGVSVERDEWDAISAGRNWRQFLPEMLQGRSEIPAERVAQRKAEIYPGMLGRTRINAALVAMIRGARPRWRTALVTTASRASAVAVLDYHDIGQLFDTIVTGNDVLNHKPAPDAYALAADRLGLAPEQCLVIEDSAVGISAAAAFGAQCMVIGAIAAGPLPPPIAGMGK